MFFVLFLLASLLGCERDKKSKDDAIVNNLRQKVVESVTSNNWNTLYRTTYDSLVIKDLPDEEEARYWAALSFAFLNENIPEESEKSLLQALRKNRHHEGVDSLIFLLGEALDVKTERQLMAKTYYKILVDYYPESEFIPKSNNNLPEDMQDLSAQIKDAQKILRSKINANLELDAKLIKDYIALAQLHAAFLSSASSSKNILKAAAVARGYGNNAEARILYDIVLQDFKGSDDSAEALFQKAFMLDQIGENDEAEQLYTAFISTYPEHKLLAQVRLLLKDVHLTEEEILKRLNNAQ